MKKNTDCDTIIDEQNKEVTSKTLYSIKKSIKNCTAKVYIFIGGKESSTIQKSAKIIQKTLQGSLLQVLSELYHGEFSINRGKEYANKIRELMRN